ncbi:hypothetical protein, partial [Oceanispirochaeta sp.]|uniref:hypothetical protein n=1 Tax=Oceanispirochaeta sp. TaxID=2035350 RepID=UPI0026298790
NNRWVDVLKTLDKTTLLDLFSFSYEKMLSIFDNIETLDNPAMHNVKWYSDDISPWWLDIAREYTELWMHATQIFKALDNGFTFDSEYLSLFYKICLLALNRTYKNVNEEIQVQIKIAENHYIFNNSYGFLEVLDDKKTTAAISISNNVAWKVFSGIKMTPEELNSVIITGNRNIGKMFLEIESVMIKAI